MRLFSNNAQPVPIDIITIFFLFEDSMQSNHSSKNQWLPYQWLLTASSILNVKQPFAFIAQLFIIASFLTLNIQAAEQKEDPTQPPKLKNKAYILIDHKTGKVLAESQSSVQLPPASLTKMMTSYLFEQKLTNGEIKEDDLISVSKTAECNRRKGESCMFLKAGKPASALDVLRGIVIQSGNDASRAIAEHIGGNETDFVKLMNQEAKKLGLENSHFMNATGMPAEGHYSTAEDLAKLAQAIISKNSKYYPVYAEKEFTYAGVKQYNRNRLLFTGKSTDGLKTGHTNAAGYCLVASAKRGDMRLISVVLGTHSKQARTNQSRKLLNWGFDNFKTQIIAPKNTFVAKTKVWFANEDEINLGVGKELAVMLNKNDNQDIQIVKETPKSLKAPLKKGDEVGLYKAVLNGQTIASAPVVVLKDIPQAGFFSRMWDHIKLFIADLRS